MSEVSQKFCDTYFSQVELATLNCDSSTKKSGYIILAG